MSPRINDELEHTTDERRKLVETLAGVGVPEEQIGHTIGVSAKTLRKRYRKQLDIGLAKANGAVGSAFFTACTRDRNPACLIWWTKTRMKWKEQPTEGAGAANLLTQDQREELFNEIVKQMALEQSQYDPVQLPAIEHEPMKDVTPTKLNGKGNGHG